MKTIVKRAIRDQGGQVLALVLILLVLGGLILAPLLGLMTTGLMSGQVYENKMYEYYAADAGIEDALWQLTNEDTSNIHWPLVYDLTNRVNDKQVRVAIDPVWLLAGLSDPALPSDQPEPGDDNYANDHWTVTGAINIEDTANYIIDITSDEPNAENATVTYIGVWLPPGYSYVEGSTEINDVGVGGGNNLVQDPVPPEGIPYKDGTFLVWDFGDVSFKELSDISPSSPGGCTPAQKFPPSVSLSFDYSYTGSDGGAEQPGQKEYSAPGTDTFTVPPGVTSVTVEAWGGGGGGGGRSSSGSGGAGGGGGGAYAEATASVTPGATYTVTVGGGGSGGLGNNNGGGSTGGDSWFGSQSTILAKGGAGGGGGVGGSGGGGGSAGSSVGSVKYSGGNGAAGSSSWSSNYRSGGGGGGAGDAAAGGNASGATGGVGGNEGGGDGANGRTDNGPGYDGTALGGGGSGARRTSGGPYVGGDGAPGKVIVRYQGGPSEEPATAKGFFSWILLGNSRVAWDSQAGIFYITSQAASDLDLGAQAGTTVDTYSVVSLRRYSSGSGGTTSAVQGDYIAIGNSLMTSAWLNRSGSSCDSFWNPYRFTNPVRDPNYTGNYYVDACRGIRGSLWQESSATVNANAVPPDARIQKAYLYWTGFLRNSDEPDQEVMLKVNDGTGGTVRASRSYVVPNPAEQYGGWQYSCSADVTREVEAITTEVNGVTFTVGGVFATPAEEGTRGTWNEFANAAWSMIIIYSSQQKETHQIYVYDDALAIWEDNYNFIVTGFQAPALNETDMDAQLAVFVAEGDKHYDDEYLRFKGAQTDFYTLGDPGTGYPNPYNNVFNGYSTATGFMPSALIGQAAGTISGNDIDIYTQDRYGTPLSEIVQPGDTSATIRFELEDSSDYIMLVYVVFSVRSIAPLGEGFDVGTMTYQIG